jgi:hypothetical protein
LILEGFDIQQLLNQVLEFYICHPEVPDLKKARIAEAIGEADLKLIQGGDEELNLIFTLSCIREIIKN